jgi:hypothetical protein
MKDQRCGVRDCTSTRRESGRSGLTLDGEMGNLKRIARLSLIRRETTTREGTVGIYDVEGSRSQLFGEGAQATQSVGKLQPTLVSHLPLQPSIPPTTYHLPPHVYISRETLTKASGCIYIASQTTHFQGSFLVFCACILCVLHLPVLQLSSAFIRRSCFPLHR